MSAAPTGWTSYFFSFLWSAPQEPQQTPKKQTLDRYDKEAARISPRRVPKGYISTDWLLSGQYITLRFCLREELISQYLGESLDIAEKMVLDEHRISCRALAEFKNLRETLIQSFERFGAAEDLKLGGDSYKIKEDLSTINKALLSKVMGYVKKARSVLRAETFIDEIGNSENPNLDRQLLVKHIIETTQCVRAAPINSFPHTMNDEALEILTLVSMRYLPAFENQLQYLQTASQGMHRIFSKQLREDKEEVEGIRTSDTNAKSLQESIKSIETATRDLMCALREKRPYLFDGFTPVQKTFTEYLFTYFSSPIKTTSFERLRAEGSDHVVAHYFLRLKEFQHTHSSFFVVKKPPPLKINLA